MVKYVNAAGVAARIPVPNGPRRRGNLMAPVLLPPQRALETSFRVWIHIF